MKHFQKEYVKESEIVNQMQVPVFAGCEAERFTKICSIPFMMTPLHTTGLKIEFLASNEDNTTSTMMKDLRDPFQCQS